MYNTSLSRKISSNLNIGEAIILAVGYNNYEQKTENEILPLVRHVTEKDTYGNTILNLLRKKVAAGLIVGHIENHRVSYSLTILGRQEHSVIMDRLLQH